MEHVHEAPPASGKITLRERCLPPAEDRALSAQIGQRALVFAVDGLRVLFDDLLGIANFDQTVFTD